MTATAHAPTVVRILDTDVTLPVEVRDATAGAAVFAGRYRTAQALLPDGLTALQLAPRVSPVFLVMVDYRDNDLGDYNEAAIILPCVPTRANRRPVVTTLQQLRSGQMGAYVHRMPVNQEFTCAAGNGIWGYPKTVDTVEIDHSGERARCTWKADGEFVWELSMPTGGSRPAPETSASTYSVMDGKIVRTCFTSSSKTVRVGMGGAHVALGDHPIADELNSLLLSTRSLTNSWIEGMQATFAAPVPAS